MIEPTRPSCTLQWMDVCKDSTAPQSTECSLSYSYLSSDRVQITRAGPGRKVVAELTDPRAATQRAGWHVTGRPRFFESRAPSCLVDFLIESANSAGEAVDKSFCLPFWCWCKQDSSCLIRKCRDATHEPGLLRGPLPITRRSCERYQHSRPVHGWIHTGATSRYLEAWSIGDEESLSAWPSRELPQMLYTVRVRVGHGDDGLPFSPPMRVWWQDLASGAASPTTSHLPRAI